MNYYFMNPPQNFKSEMEKMYPDIYITIYPLVIRAAEDMMNSGMPFTESRLNSVIDNVIRSSGMWDEDDDRQPMGVVPASAPFIRRGRGHHNRNTMRDLVRILLLRELFSK